MTETATEEKPLDRYECRACGYVYEPQKGARGVEPGTAFEEIPSKWRCPVCGATKTQFNNIGSSETAGFSENYRYGLGVNNLTAGQKNLLIFGGLALAALFFLSLYGLQ